MEARQHIAQAHVLAGVLPQLQAYYWQQKTVVLASGDPLFYGIGPLLLEACPKDDVVFLPHVSSVQLTFARLKESQQDGCVVSLHGRPLHTLLPALRLHVAKIPVLTDATNHPVALAPFLTSQAMRTTCCGCARHLGAGSGSVSLDAARLLQGSRYLRLSVIRRPGSMWTPMCRPLRLQRACRTGRGT